LPALHAPYRRTSQACNARDFIRRKPSSQVNAVNGFISKLLVCVFTRRSRLHKRSVFTRQRRTSQACNARVSYLNAERPHIIHHAGLPALHAPYRRTSQACNARDFIRRKPSSQANFLASSSVLSMQQKLSPQSFSVTQFATS